MYTRVFMVVFVASFIALQVAYGGTYAMGICVIPAMSFLTLFPYGAASLVSLLKGQKHNSVMTEICLFLKDGIPDALFCCVRPGFVSATRKELLNLCRKAEESNDKMLTFEVRALGENPWVCEPEARI